MLLTRKKEIGVRAIFSVAASFSILIVFLVFLFLAREALPFVREPGLTTLWGAIWRPISFQQPLFGILPLLSGSILVTGLAGLITAPLGIGGAVYIAEVAQPWERELLKPIIEVLAGIPSVVLGFFGLAVVAPAVKAMFGLNSGLTALTGALVLALMALPTVISVSEDAIRSVPESFKQASLALGATTQQTIWGVVVPAAIPGITAATMLGFGRIIGETMAVLMVTGNAATFTLNPFDSVRTMTATIANEMGEVPFGSTHYQALFCVGMVLLFSTFLLNILALRMFKHYGLRQ
ncbi:MAG: phosphate ABC transporter permease subunit PstC [Candidatus Hydrogenedentes bacterium]|nr:phosphate ABC transporter permease subunit PstC [Candidatus Hydrogenedentota bacterium]MBI3118312.1 phosphate ABC transporter permease subunit PstC [Candidatus Hydrogenedentota bacterium]